MGYLLQGVCILATAVLAGAGARIGWEFADGLGHKAREKTDDFIEGARERGSAAIRDMRGRLPGGRKHATEPTNGSLAAV